MKRCIFLAAVVMTLISCNNKKQDEMKVAENKTEYAVFGDSITTDGVITKEAMLAKFKDMKEGDTLNLKFKSDIKDVCQKKGCWMTLDLSDGKETFVKFKDYAFFVPMNASKQEAVVSGKAFVNIESVEQLKHYAKDGGKSQAAIDSIKEPKVTYAFMADGVLISK